LGCTSLISGWLKKHAVLASAAKSFCAEQVAQERGCNRSHLTTYSFQALDFYKEHGYQVFAELDHYPGNWHRYFLWKDLEADLSEL
jgi:hypothetical protein